MRIISGFHKGFRFPERNMPHARPTTDRAKEALFNILDQRFYFNEIAVLDLYTGLGGIALEFASRGCEDITTIDFNNKSVNYVKQIATKLKLPIQIRQEKVLSFLKKNAKTYDIIFADPPYQAANEINELLQTMQSGSYLNPNGIFILEHVSSFPMKHLGIIDQRKYGQSTFSFFTFDHNNE